MADIYEDGEYRKSTGRKVNPLLVRSVVGKVRASTYDLPGNDFIYGRAEPEGEEGTREVVGSWLEHRKNPDKVPGRDFVKMNKVAARQGCVTSKHIAAYRKNNDIRLGTSPQKDRTARQKKALASSKIPADMIFGAPGRPSTPINGLLSNSYQRNWIEAQRDAEAKRREKAHTARTATRASAKQRSNFHTKASLGHRKKNEPAPKKPFKMKQFANVPSRISQPGGSFSVRTTARGVRQGRQTPQHQASPPQPQHEQPQFFNGGYYAAAPPPGYPHGDSGKGYYDQAGYYYDPSQGAPTLDQVQQQDVQHGVAL